MEERCFGAAVQAGKTKGFSPWRGSIRTYNLCFLGFGNVNRTLVRLLDDRTTELRDRYGIAFRVTGMASRRLGWIANPDGLHLRHAGPSPHDLPMLDQLPRATRHSNVSDWLAATGADVLFEATSLNVQDGQPAVDYIRAALEHGAHAITANKGPIVHAYRELRDLAGSKGRRFLFESTVMDGVPIFSLFDQLPAVHL